MRIRYAGFTMVELISVMLIIGILAVAALPRFFDRQGYDARSSYDQTIALLRYAQKSAIAQRRTVCVTFSPAAAPTTITLTIAALFGGPCNTALNGPSGTGAYTLTGLTFVGAPASFTFNPQGQPSALPAIQISTASDVPTITVELETGYVH